jgi:transcriptional regulator with XRE-family HTH domain
MSVTQNLFIFTHVLDSSTQKNSKMEISSNIRKVRESKNYSQEFMAVRLGVSQNVYSRMEQGLAKIEIERLLQISEILETSISDLIGAKDRQTVNITNNQTVNGNVSNNTPINEVKSLHEKQIELYVTIIEEKDKRIKSLEKEINSLRMK